MTGLEALKIITNLRDIQIVIIKKNGKFGFVIFRKLEHSCELPIITVACLETREDAVGYIKLLLKAALKEALSKLGDGSTTSKIPNSKACPEIIFDDGCWQRLTRELREKNIVNVWEPLTGAASTS